MGNNDGRDVITSNDVGADMTSGGVTLPDDYKPHAVTDSVHQRGMTRAGVDRAREQRMGRQARSVGTGSDLLSVDLLRTLPVVFLDYWERILLLTYTDSALMVKSSGSGRDIGIPGTGKGSGGLGAVKSETPDVMDVYRTGQSSSVSSSPFRSELALSAKSRVERKLRRLGREMKLFVDSLERAEAQGVGLTKVMRKCRGKCKKFGDGDWVFCPWCGGPMSELD